MRIFLGLMGALFLLYGMVSLRTNRLNTGVLAFLAIGILFIFAAKYLSSISQFFNKRKSFRATIIFLFLMGLVSAVCLESAIISGMKEQHPKNIDCILVLGAGVRDGAPTPVLKTRLEKTIEIHHLYPDTKIFVTGGLDTGEELTEAFVMKEYLVNHGISDKMIVMENKATSTQENFEYTKQLIQTPNPKIIVVTSNFHLYRAKFYAKQTGFISYSAGASIPLSIVPLTHIREILAVGYMLVKNGMSASF